MLDIHYRFRKILEGSETLVICGGYSFGNKALNTQLIFWHNANRPRSIAVIDFVVDWMSSNSHGLLQMSFLKDQPIYPGAFEAEREASPLGNVQSNPGRIRSSPANHLSGI